MNVREGELTTHMWDGEVTFNVFKVLKRPIEQEKYYTINIIEQMVLETLGTKVNCNEDEFNLMKSLNACAG